MDTTTLGDRMKQYEKVNTRILDPNQPIIIRLDGKGFSKFTKKFNKPFDIDFHSAMTNAVIKTCESIQQVRFAYSQSDEISILLSGWDNEESQPWFGGKVEKIASVSASTITYWFNAYIRDVLLSKNLPIKPAYFDSRVFNIPENDVRNVFVWRQQDAKRNSIIGNARQFFSHKELFKVNTTQMLEKMLDKGFDWNSLTSLEKWGFTVSKKPFIINNNGVDVIRSKWFEDFSVPYFVSRPDYLTDLIKGDV